MDEAVFLAKTLQEELIDWIGNPEIKAARAKKVANRQGREDIVYRPADGGS